MTELAKGPHIKADLGQGFPDFEGDDAALVAARTHLGPAEGDAARARLQQYSAVSGPPSLREALAEWYAKRYADGRRIDGDKELIVCTSGTEALYVALASLLEPGDNVLVFEPAFPWYRPHVEAAGGKMVAVQLRFPGFPLPGEGELRAVFEEHRPRVVVFNTPHNPSGHVASRGEVALLARLCVEFDAFCVSDEVYEVFVFAPGQSSGKVEHLRICDEPGMWERTLTVGSASKMFSVTGWRVGWLYTGCPELLAACRALHGYITYCAPTPLQEAVKDALLDAIPRPEALPAQLPALRAAFHANASSLAACMGARFGAAGEAPDGGYFLVLDISSSGKTDFQFCEWLAKEKGVVAIPMQMFYSHDPPSNLIRLAICKSPALMAKAIAALES